jgi:hypothetical protein
MCPPDVDHTGSAWLCSGQHDARTQAARQAAANSTNAVRGTCAFQTSSDRVTGLVKGAHVELQDDEWRSNIGTAHAMESRLLLTGQSALQRTV